jgi:hypothetical protein
MAALAPQPAPFAPLTAVRPFPSALLFRISVWHSDSLIGLCQKGVRNRVGNCRVFNDHFYHTSRVETTWFPPGCTTVNVRLDQWTKGVYRD